MGFFKVLLITVFNERNIKWFYMYLLHDLLRILCYSWALIFDQDCARDQDCAGGGGGIARDPDCARVRLRASKIARGEILRAIKNARGKDCARSRLQTSKIARDQECAGEDCARSRLQASKIARGKDCAGERLRAIKTAREKDCARVRLCGIKIARLCWRLEDHVFLIFRVVEKGWPYGAGVMENMTSLV